MSQHDGYSVRQEVLDATDLVALVGEHISLERKGREHVGKCPFHDDTRPSLSIVTHKGAPFYKCHACGASGTAFDFVMEYHHLTFPEALNMLADRAGIQIRRTAPSGERAAGSSTAAIFDANRFAIDAYHHELKALSADHPASVALRARGYSADTIEAYAIGYAPIAERWDWLVQRARTRGIHDDLLLSSGLSKQRQKSAGQYDVFRNRIVFPIFDEIGRPVAMGGRRVNPEDEPKYLNSPESAVFQKSRTLFGVQVARRAILKDHWAIVVEGYTDVLTCHEAGLLNVVGTLGTALTDEHARKMGRWCDRVVLVFDGDAAGQRAADRAVEVFFRQSIDIDICILPEGDDPDTLLRQTNGLQQFRQALDSSVDALEFLLNSLKQNLQNNASISSRQKLIEAFLARLAGLGLASADGMRRRLVLSRLEQMLDVPVYELDRTLKAFKPRQTRTASTDNSSRGVSTGDSLHAISPEDGVSRRRQVAETELLALLIAEPGLNSEHLQLIDAVNDSVWNIMSPADFKQSRYDRIAKALAAAHAQQALPTVHWLMSECPARHDRDLISTLQVEGSKRMDNNPCSPSEQAAEAVHALWQLVRREADTNQTRHDATDDSTQTDDSQLLGVLEAIANRREDRVNPGAILHGVRP